MTSACGGIQNTPVVVSAPSCGAAVEGSNSSPVRLQSTRELSHRPLAQTRIFAPRFQKPWKWRAEVEPEPNLRRGAGDTVCVVASGKRGRTELSLSNRRETS